MIHTQTKGHKMTQSNLNQAGLIRAVDAFNSTAKGIGEFPTNALKAAISAYLECVASNKSIAIGSKNNAISNNKTVVIDGWIASVASEPTKGDSK